MSRMRLPFLPSFLIILAIAFGVALASRIRSYGGHAGLRGDGSDVSSTISGPSATTRRSSSASPDDVAQNGGAQTMTLVDVHGNPISPTGGPSAREQKYHELLNAPPPPRAAAAAQAVPARQTISAGNPPQKPQSAIAKIAQPARNPFAGSAAQASSQQTTAQRQPPNSDTPPGKPVERDPSTDTTPPQVMQVQFDPPQVHDGESSAVIVTATDDLSGIRGISGTVTSPNGKALQGFACQREAPESNRYIGRVTVPKDAEEGNWHINFLNVSDMASNSVTLSYAQTPLLQAAQLKVTSSRPDNTPPTVKAAWIDRRAMHAGEKNTLFVQVQDDKSGVNLVSAVFLSPKQWARIGVACHQGDSDVWPCEFTVPACLDCGDWQLEQIQLQDKASNMGAVRYNGGDESSKLVAAVQVNIAGDSCDPNPPVLQSVVMGSNSIASTPQGGQVDVQVSVTDDGCGMASVSAQVIGPNGGSGGFFAFTAQGSTYIGHMPIPPLAGKGIWKINWLQVMDKGNNLRVYYAADPLLRNAVVTVR